MKQLFYINNYPINSGSHCFITMACSYNSDWNDFVKIECEKLRKKGHVFDAEGTHMKIIGEKYQKKLAREEKKKSQPGGAKSKKQQNNEDVASCINTMNNASYCCTLSGYIDAVSRCEGIYQEWLVTNPSKAKLLQDELIRHQRLVSTRIAKSKYNDKCKDKKRQDREEAKAKQQEELAKVQKEAEAKRIQDIAVAKALQDLLEVRERETKKHRDELEKANARAKEAEELVKAMERDQIAKSNAKAKELEEIVNAANARANEREKIVKSKSGLNQNLKLH